MGIVSNFSVPFRQPTVDRFPPSEDVFQTIGNLLEQPRRGWYRSRAISALDFEVVAVAE